MGHLCGSTCKRITGAGCDTCRRPGTGAHDDGRGPTPVKVVRRHATPQEIGAAVDMYFDGLSYRRTAENIGDYFGRDTEAMSVFRWVKDQTRRVGEVVEDFKIATGPEWVADEIAVKVGGKQYWLFNIMDADSRFILAAYLTPTRTKRDAATALSIARRRAANPPKTVKTDGLRSYQGSVKVAFPVYEVKHVVSKGIRAVVNNNLSERLQGTIRDRDKTLRGLKTRDSGQTYVDGLVLNYNYFRPHEALEGKRPAEGAGAVIPWQNWRDVAAMESQSNTA